MANPFSDSSNYTFSVATNGRLYSYTIHDVQGSIISVRMSPPHGVSGLGWGTATYTFKKKWNIQSITWGGGYLGGSDGGASQVAYLYVDGVYSDGISTSGYGGPWGQRVKNGPWIGVTEVQLYNHINSSYGQNDSSTYYLIGDGVQQSANAIFFGMNT